MFKALFFFALCIAILSADEGNNIHEQYHKRSQQYPTNGYQKILVYSPYRTGSTIVFNVLRFLFEDSDFLCQKIPWGHNKSIVGKTHNLGYIDPSAIIFCTIRNPEDACFSRYRVMNPGKFQKVNEKALDIAVQDYLTQMKWMHDLLQKRFHNVVLLKYENFDSKLEVIFDKVENLFNIEICEMDRALMEEAFSKENVALFTKKFENFKKSDNLTLFHGAHIEGDEFSKEEKAFISEEIRKRLSGKCSFLEQYGYAL